MKKYIREKKKWVSVEEYDRFYSKKKEGCRGGKPHDFLLVLPDYLAKWDGKSPYNAKAYYDKMDERREFIKKQEDELLVLGIICRENSWRVMSRETRRLMCSVCKKQDYEFPK